MDPISELARTGCVVFVKNKDCLTTFYENVLGMERVLSDAEHDVLSSADTQLIIHAIPTKIADTIKIDSPPTLREAAALKLFFTVPSLRTARKVASELSGVDTAEPWEGFGFVACDAYDPEGNVFQLREWVGKTPNN